MIEDRGLYVEGWDIDAAAKTLTEAIATASQRTHLSPERKSELEWYARQIGLRLSDFRNAPVRGKVIELTMLALFAGLNAMLTDEEIENLRRSFYGAKQRRAAIEKAQKARKLSPKRNYARKIFSELPPSSIDRSPHWIANAIAENWNPNNHKGVVDCPNIKTLAGYAKDFLKK